MVSTSALFGSSPSFKLDFAFSEHLSRFNLTPNEYGGDEIWWSEDGKNSTRDVYNIAFLPPESFLRNDAQFFF